MKLMGALPKGQANGLSLITDQMCDEPARTWAVVAVIDCKKLTTDLDTGDVEPTARIRHIEVVTGEEHLGLLQRIMRRALSTRTGKEVLPLNLEDEVIEAFKGVRIDLRTGEVVSDDNEPPAES